MYWLSKKSSLFQTGEYEQLVPTLTEEGIAEMRNMLQRVDTIATVIEFSVLFLLF